MLTSDFSKSDIIKELVQSTKDVFTDAAKPAQNSQISKPSFLTRLCNWAQSTERDKRLFDQQQQALQQQKLIGKASLSLKHLFSYALNRVPSHLDFWGDLSPHSIHLIYSCGVWSFPLIHSLDAHAMPVTFHQTAAELQAILSDIYANATHVLGEKIRIDAELYASQYWDIQLVGSSPCKSDQNFWNDFCVQYRAYADYLWVISGVSIAPTSNGVMVSFIATFNDCGLSPACYWQNMHSILRI